MSDFLRGFWRVWVDERTQRWVLPPFAAAGFFGVFANTAPGWRLWCLALGVLYMFAAGWLWRGWATRRRLMRMLHEAAAALAGGQEFQRAAADELTRMRYEGGL